MELDAAVYTFLVRCGHAKAAETFLRETKRKEPSLSSSKLDLCEIFATHQKQQKQSASSQVLQQQKRKQPAPSTTAPAASTSKKLKVESDSEDSDDSDDSDDDSDSDSSDSSSEDSEEERKTLLKRMEVKEAERKARAEEAAKAAAKWAEVGTKWRIDALPRMLSYSRTDEAHLKHFYSSSISLCLSRPFLRTT